jgi:hypothetical protein
LFTDSPPRSSLSPPDPKLFYAIGLKRQQNLIYLGLACGQFCKNISDRPSNSPIPDCALDQLSWALALYTTLISTLVNKPDLFPVLFKLEENLATIYAEANPSVTQLWEIENHVKLLKASLPKQRRGAKRFRPKRRPGRSRQLSSAPQTQNICSKRR